MFIKTIKSPNPSSWSKKNINYFFIHNENLFYSLTTEKGRLVNRVSNIQLMIIRCNLPLALPESDKN